MFERFLNPERMSMPDFDIDFCIEGRQAVKDYVSAPEPRPGPTGISCSRAYRIKSQTIRK